MAVRRVSPLNESDGRLAWLTETLAAHVGSVKLPSGATLRRHVDRVCVLSKRCRCSECIGMMSCLMHIVPEDRACCLCV